jgi:hypothetical protein
MENTALTILGMIAAFLTASITPVLTESVKNYMQHKAKLRALRVALYKEIWNNVVSMTHFPHRDIECKLELGDELTKHALRKECYEHALKNELTLFYELKEADLINRLQGTILGQMLSFSIDSDATNIEYLLEDIFAGYVYDYQELFTAALDDGPLDKKVLESFLVNSEYKILQDLVETRLGTEQS